MRWLGYVLRVWKDRLLRSEFEARKTGRRRERTRVYNRYTEIMIQLGRSKAIDGRRRKIPIIFSYRLLSFLVSFNKLTAI